MRWVVFDIDGTLADCSHRVAHAQMKEWDQFHSKCSEDAVIKNVADLLRGVAHMAHVMLLTGRPEKYRQQTLDWLVDAQLDGYQDELIMRPENDWTRDGEMKIAALERIFGTQEGVLENVWFVIDDRDTVVEALRNYGLTVFQPSVGGY